jgi:hypothetical protein
MKKVTLIGVSGKKRSGKDEFCKISNEIFPEYPYQCKKFAAKLKDICSYITGLPIEWFYDGKHNDYYLSEWNMNIRELQQKVGTEAFRNNISENTWVNALFANREESSRWIITDVRFPNEVNAIKERNGLLVRIERPSSDHTDTHPSETSLDDYNNWDFLITNNSTLENYKNKVIEFYNKFMS